MLELFRIAGLIDLKGQDQAEKGLDTIDKKAEGTGGKFSGMAKKVGKAGLVVGGAMVAAGTAAFAMTTKVTGAFDDISKGAQRVGVSTDFYQEMDFWAIQNGMSHENMEKAVGRFNQRLGMAQNGNEKYSSALQQMGIDMEAVRDGTLSTEDAFAQSIKSLSEMENQQDQVNLATEMFGVKLSREMLPALQDGALSIDEAKEKAQELGMVIGEDSLDAAVVFQDTWDQLKRSLGAAGMQIGAQLIPIFQTMMDWILANMPMIQDIFSTVFGVIQTLFSTVVTWVQTFVMWLQTLFTTNQETMAGIWTTIQEYFTLVVEFLRESWEQIKVFWDENGQQILENAKETFQAIWATISTVFQAIWQVIQTILNLVVPFVQKQVDKIRQFWEENGEQIMEAVQVAFNFIKGVIDTVMPVLIAIIRGAWSIISSVFDAAVGIIMGIVKYFSSLLTGDFEGMQEAVTDIWESLWDGIKGIVEGAWDLLSGAFSALWDSISGWFTDLGSEALSWGEDLIKGFWEGIKSMGSWLGGKVTGFISDNVPGPIKKVLGIASPSKLARVYGQDTIEGFALGAEDKEDRVRKVSESVADTVSKPIVRNVNNTRNVSSGSTTNISLKGMLEGAIFQVREEADIKKIAKELGDYTNRQARSQGVVRML